jgi:hypothetical protein
MGGGWGLGIGPIGWVWGGPPSGGAAGGEAGDGGAGALLGDAEVVGGLEVEPEEGVGAEPVAEAQGGIAGDGAAGVDDLADAVGWDGDLTGHVVVHDGDRRSTSFAIKMACYLTTATIPFAIENYPRQRRDNQEHTAGRRGSTTFRPLHSCS